MNSRPRVTPTNTSRCLSGPEARVRKRIWRSTTLNSPIVRHTPLIHFDEPNVHSLTPGDLEQLIQHGLHSLRETLQQDKELTINNTSIGIIGPAGQHETGVQEGGSFRILEGDKIDVYLKSMIPKETEAPAAGAVAPAAGGNPGDEDVQMGE
jgi:hypothetical protein